MLNENLLKKALTSVSSKKSNLKAALRFRKTEWSQGTVPMLAFTSIN